MFRTSEVKKTYWAVVKMLRKNRKVNWYIFLYVMKSRTKVMHTTRSAEQQESDLALPVDRSFGELLFARSRFKTGRHHQIRCQLAKWDALSREI